MTLESIQTYCLNKKGVSFGFPFGFDILVGKVGSKMFILINFTQEDLKISVKCEPSYAQYLRQQYLSIIPGYHLNKKHWNTISIDKTLSEELVLQLIDHSYDLVFCRLAKSEKQTIES